MLSSVLIFLPGAKGHLGVLLDWKRFKFAEGLDALVE